MGLLKRLFKSSISVSVKPNLTEDLPDLRTGRESGYGVPPA